MIIQLRDIPHLTTDALQRDEQRLYTAMKNADNERVWNDLSIRHERVRMELENRR